MPGGTLRLRIFRLQKEIERLSTKHAEKMAKPSTNQRTRELDAKRAEILAKRMRELAKLLDSVQVRAAHRSR